MFVTLCMYFFHVFIRVGFFISLSTVFFYLFFLYYLLFFLVCWHTSLRKNKLGSSGLRCLSLALFNNNKKKWIFLIISSLLIALSQRGALSFERKMTPILSEKQRRCHRVLNHGSSVSTFSTNAQLGLFISNIKRPRKSLEFQPRTDQALQRHKNGIWDTAPSLNVLIPLSRVLRLNFNQFKGGKKNKKERSRSLQ